MWNPLTNDVPYPLWPLVGWSVAAEEVDGHSGQGDAYADQRVDGVTVERHDHQEDGQQAENDGVEEAELREGDGEEEKKLGLSLWFWMQ